MLLDILEAVSSAKDIKMLLESTLGRMLKALYSDRGSIFLVGENEQELFLKLSHDINGDSFREVKKKVGEGVVGKVARDRIPLLVKDIRKDARFCFSNQNNHYRTNSFLCVPITIDSKLIGVINITENKLKKPYSEKDLRFLKAAADFIAFRIQNSNLSCELECLKKKIANENKFADLGKFAGGISHELSSPLDGVTRYVNLALNSMGEEASKQYLVEAKTGLERITNIIQSLRGLANRKVFSAPRFVDINRSLETCIDIVQEKARYKNIRIRKEFCHGLPKIPDYGLESIFTNIVNNAIEAIMGNGSITVRTYMSGSLIEVSITDTGCGIDKKDLEHIFEPFFTTKPVSKGLGLGLSLSYEIIKRYNGNIDVVSEPGSGSAFKVRIPYSNNTQ